MNNINWILSNVNGNSFIGLDTETDVALKGGRKNPMLNRVKKRTVGSQVMVFQNRKSNAYDNMVKRRLEAEGKDPSSFTLSPRKWGSRIPNSPFVVHIKDDEVKHYLEVIFLRPGKSEYLLDGKHIDKSEIEGLNEREVPVSDEVQGGLANHVIVRTYDVNSIIGVRVDNDRFSGKFYYSE